MCLDTEILQETCWTLSNIVAGTPAQMAVVCDAGTVVSRVIEQLESAEWEVQKEANFVISNIATAGDGEKRKWSCPAPGKLFQLSLQGFGDEVVRFLLICRCGDDESVSEHNFEKFLEYRACECIEESFLVD